MLFSGLSDFLFQLSIRVAVMVPVVMIAAAALWYGVKAFGAARSPFNARDMRSWPLRFALADAALFGATFALVAVLLGDSEWTSIVGGGVSALVAIGLGPILLERFGGH
jgi:hydrogenase/urease accessory protein HupE